MENERIRPRAARDWSDEVWQGLALIGVTRPEPEQIDRWSSNLLGLYAVSPGFTSGWMPFSQHLKHSSLPARVRELVILRTTFITQGEYEWAEHRKIALASGFTEDEIEAVTRGSDDPQWGHVDALVLAAVDEMVRTRNVSDELWAGLSGSFDEAQLVDLVFMVGTYDMHSMAFNTLGLRLEPGAEGFAAARADHGE